MQSPTLLLNKRRTLTLLLFIFFVFPYQNLAQDSLGITADRPGEINGIDTTITAGEAEGDQPKRRLVSWNEYEGPFATFRLGLGFLYEAATYIQDDVSKEHFELVNPDHGLRDFRFLIKGKLKFIERPVSYSAGIMWDGATRTWQFRQTGLMIAVPELWGHLFIGRTKEGFSQNKIMVGYHIWTMERQPANDAFIQILGDGIKWMGYLPNRRLLWNIGWYTDWLAEGSSFSKYDNLVVGRLVWLNLPQESKGNLLHVGIMGRWGKVNDEKLILKSRPEAYLTPYYLDTGPIKTKQTYMAGTEIYYRPGSWLFGSEYFMQWVKSAEKGNPFFHGGEVFAAWLITGEARGYNTAGGYFKGMEPEESVLDGGPGAWEAVLRFSYLDLDSGPVKGGRFWKITPMVNWHITAIVHMQFAYGYGTLYRFDSTSGTHFFQSRVQVSF